MPVSVDAELRQLSQTEFAKVSYDVMAEIFALQREFGHLFSENVYQNALKERLDNVQTEVEIKVSFDDFQKSYFMDVLAAAGGIFELKAVNALHVQHRTQLINYLYLTELKHGKLINVRSEQVEHEFINATKPIHERRSFTIFDSDWRESDGFNIEQKTLITEIVRDWGTGLERSLYQQALAHFISTSNQEECSLDVIMNGQTIATQPILLCAPLTAFKVTSFEDDTAVYRNDLFRLLNNTPIKTIQWINIARKQICFHTISEE